MKSIIKLDKTKRRWSLYKIDDQNPKKPPTKNSSLQQKKLDFDTESNYKDFKSENTKGLAAV